MSLKLRTYGILVSFLLVFFGVVHAMPVFLLTPKGPVQITISSGEIKTVSYLIQNNPKNPYTLTGVGIVNLPHGVNWILGGSCGMPTFSLTSGQSCTVLLQINGSQLTRSVHGGPQVSGRLKNRVYNSQPSADNQLTVIKKEAPPKPQATLTVIAVPNSITYHDTSTLSTTGGSGNGAVTYSVVSGGSSCSISGSTLTGINVGTCSVTATKAEDTNYQSTTSNLITVTVTKGAQATLTAIAAPSLIGVGDSSALSTTGGSGSGAVTYSVVSGGSSCSISGSTLTGINVGSCSVTATKAEDTNYQSTTSNVITITVTKGQQAILTANAVPSLIGVGNTSTLSTNGGSGGGTVTYSVVSGDSFCSISGSTLTGMNIGTCSVNAMKAGDTNYESTTSDLITVSIAASFPVSEGPNNVFAIPGNGQASISWTAPSNTGTGTIKEYIITYGSNSGTIFNQPGCTASVPLLTCTVTGLTNGTAYIFSVRTVTQKNSLNQTGPASLSSAITPIDGLVISPATLALSSIGNPSVSRIITLTNTSNTPILLNSIPLSYSDFTPALPSDVTIASTCSAVSSLAANGGSCTITITPGSTVSRDSLSQVCTLGRVPVPSTFEIVPGSSIRAIVLGYGCVYQGGYLFSINDNTPTTESIGGKVVATTEQAPAFPNGIDWSPNGADDSIWGIDDASTISTPSPNASSTFPATFKTGQLNCDAVNSGMCATNNIQVIYSSSSISYAAGLCRKPLAGNNGATACAGGSTCYTDWYLPSNCEIGPFGSTGVNTGDRKSVV